MHFYELRHFCATHLLELGVSHADVAVQLGHRDGGSLVMSTYGHPSEQAARERLKRAYTAKVRRLSSVPGESGGAG
jgi:integrase